LRPAGGLLGLLLARALTGSDIGLGLADPRLNLLISFAPGLVSRTLQLRYSRLQGVYLLRNALQEPAGNGTKPYSQQLPPALDHRVTVPGPGQPPGSSKAARRNQQARRDPGTTVWARPTPDSVIGRMAMQDQHYFP